MSRYKKKKLYCLKVYKTRYENQRKNIFNFINCQFFAYQYLIISNYTICNGICNGVNIILFYLLILNISKKSGKL